MKSTGRFFSKSFPLLVAFTLNVLFLAAQTAGPHCARTITTSGDNGGEAAWENSHLAACDDNASRAISDLIYGDRHTESLHFSGFDLAIPDNAVVTGIEVVMIRRSDRPQTVADKTVQLVLNGRTLGENMASSEGWDMEWTAAFYGGPEELWGHDWTAWDIKKDGFGVVIDVSGKSYSRAEIDELLVTVNYREGSSSASGSVGKACQTLPAALGM